MVKPLDGSTKSAHVIRGTKGKEKTMMGEESVTDRTEKETSEVEENTQIGQIGRRNVNGEDINVGLFQERKQLDVKHEKNTRN